jgi:hypothetical protein
MPITLGYNFIKKTIKIPLNIITEIANCICHFMAPIVNY